MSSPIGQAIRQISEEKDISAESVIETIEAALAAAYRKDFGERNQNIKVNFDQETGDFDVFDVKTVVEDMELPEVDETENQEKDGPKKGDFRKKFNKREDGEDAEDEGPRFNPKTEIMISEAQNLKKGAEMGEVISTQLEVPAAFGRMAAQTAKQVIIQKIREAERVKLFGEFKDRERELVNATVQRREGRLVLIDLGKLTAIMPPDEQVPGERYMPGDRIKVYVVSVEMTTRGPEIVVSRSHPEIIRRLFTLEIPEVAAGTVEIHNVAREGGARAKVSVSSNQDNIDPIGSCIGQRGTRIQTIISELGGEKVDVINYDEDPATYIINALSPAKVSQIELNQEEKIANVVVEDDQLSLAIGRGGQNVRLASRLTGWRINIRKIGDDEVAFVSDEPVDGDIEGEDIANENEEAENEAVVLTEEENTTEATDEDNSSEQSEEALEEDLEEDQELTSEEDKK